MTRFVGDDWSIKQRLIRLRTVSKSVNAPELAQVLNHCVATQYQIPWDLIYATMRDGASVNGAAIRSLALLYPIMIDVTCFLHTLNNAGRHFNFPLLDRFCRLWISLFSHSARAKLVWKTRTSIAIKTHSETPWWTKWEVLNQVSAFFGDVRPLLQENQDISPTTTAELLAILDNDGSRRTLQLQLAALVDIGKHLVEATYLLEGDGSLLFSCYEMLQSLATTFSQEHRPNLRALARTFADENTTLNARQLERDTMEGAKPAIMWFLQKFNVDIDPIVSAFRRARMFDPVIAQGLNITPDVVRGLSCFPFLAGEGVLQGLEDELPAYLAAIVDVHLESAIDKWHWWSRQVELVHWQDAVRKAILVQPSSAASERVFSLLAVCFNDEQRSAMAETVEASVMLRFNRRK